jgi:hypothetical protein
MRKQLALLFTLALAACSPYNPDLGDVPFLCGDGEPVCPDGYVCMPMGTQMRCTDIDGVTVDSGTIGFPCADDSALEGPTLNNTPMTAYITPVDSQRLDLTLAGIAICPAGDKDHYAVTLSTANAMKAIEVIVSWDSGQPITMSLLGAGGSPLVNGTASGDKALRACAANLPASTYYAAVFATGSTQNNYRLSIKVLQNCAI